ncbi:hypothetical protein BaRGS_00000835, partial [Batillaria attramentaria]
RMFRRPFTRPVLFAVALVVIGLCVYQGHRLAGQAIKQKFTSYGQSVGLVSKFLAPGPGPATPSADGVGYAVTPLPPGTSVTPVWFNPVYAKRRQRSEDICVKVKQGGVARLTRYGNVSYCVVPKVGCTFWLNVFRYLHNDTGKQHYPSPFDIPRMTTHYGGRKSMKYFIVNSSFTPEHLVSDLRFMFVRDPYSRLWSAYVDKFLLVDYWRTEGQNIVKQRKVKDNRTHCAGDISFIEFLDYVVSNQPTRLNEHWKPIQYLCSPCMYRPHVIGKMETFSQDVRYVLKRLNMSWIMDNYDHEAHVHGEMDMLIDYNYQVLNSKFYSNCSNTTDLAKRLWRTFQINGYLPSEMAFPQPNAAKMNASQFKALAHEAYRNRPTKSPKEWKHQREQAMVDAYKGISRTTLEKLKKLYKYDFEIFDYDPAPSRLFGDLVKAESVPNITKRS